MKQSTGHGVLWLAGHPDSIQFNSIQNDSAIREVSFVDTPERNVTDRSENSIVALRLSEK